jgi:hypothetical protein
MLRKSHTSNRETILIATALAVALPAVGALGVRPAPTLVPAGTVIDGVLQSNLSSATSAAGEKFSLVEKDRLTQRFAAAFRHQPPALHGAHIEGHVEAAKKAGLGRKATLDLVFDDVVMPNGSAVPIHAQLLSALRPQTHHLRNVALIVGGTVAGHYLGKRTGMKHGALAGAAAATAFVLSDKSDIVLNSGTVLRLRLTQPVNLAAAAASAPPSRRIRMARSANARPASLPVASRP